MRFVFLVFLLLCISTIYSQENTALLCADGIDNDGDGLIDCEDLDCISIPTDGCLTCSNRLSFADVVFDYESGCAVSDVFPDGALGVSDYNGFVTDEPEFVFLGEGGFIKLGFTDNLLSNSGDNQDDIFIFEVGTLVEPLELLVRPEDILTELELISNGLIDYGDGYYKLIDLGGATSSIDIDAVLPGYAQGELLFDAVQLIDILDRPCTGATPGADIDAVCALYFIPIDCAGVPNGASEIDDCGDCLEPTDPEYNQSCTDCAGVVNGASEIDDCGDCLEPTDPNFNQSCADCSGTPNGTAEFDDCGECLEPTNPEYNQSCTDCAGIVNGISEIDDCGECVEPTDPEYNQSCTDCAGVVNGTSELDDCGICLDLDDPTYNQACTDCAGIINGTSEIDD